MEELKMTMYEKDSSAAAVILADFGISELRYDQAKGFHLFFERVRRVKILTKEGFDWANFNIFLYNDLTGEEKISGLKAVTYNLENGKVVETKVKNESIIKEKYNENISISKVTWPNVKTGSVLELTYNVTSDFIFNFHDWEFQAKIPTKWSEYRTRIPEYFFYEKFMQGYVGLDVAESSNAVASITLTSKDVSDGNIQPSSVSYDKVEYTENRNRWAAKNVPAFKEEPHMTSEIDFISKINFELSYTRFPNTGIRSYMGTWQDINNSYLKELGQEITGNGFLKKQVDDLIVDKITPEDKIAAIFSHVRNNIQWDGLTRKYPTHALRKVIDDKKGSSAEINILLASMLEKAGIKANPVLVSTRDHGFVREAAPVSSQFNTVLCQAKWGDKQMLLDATDRSLPSGMLPEQCLNGKGFAVSKDGFEWVNLSSPVKTKTSISATFTLTDDDVLAGKLKIDRSGYHSVNPRKLYLGKGKEEYLKNLIGNKSWVLSRSEFQNETNPEQPFKEVHELTISEYVTLAGSTYYISPFVMGKEEANPFKSETRNYPVDFGAPFEQVYIFQLVLPPNVAVEELPKSKIVALPGNTAKYILNVVNNGNVISVTSSFSINKGVFDQREYANLREFFNQVVSKQAEQIVLKRN
ncbi:MAG: DUF3857 and transglutaminase domain-containing protein [Cyclobacteriaceae bacterium]|jgi:hypothetical protein|nr:DUF3857 and transglutaminase domain-containing protein [Cyclobacteriaceae bacterium]